MDLCNYHSHFTFCDGRAPAEDFVNAAIEAGFHSYGISSHSPLPFETDWSLKRSEVGNYLREMQRLKRIYASMLEVYVGLEIDYLNDEYGPSSLYFQQLPLDYRIGSVHYVVNPERGEMMDMDGRVEDFRRNLDKVFAGDLKLLIKNYFQASMRMVELGGFDFVAHADKVAMNGSLCDPEIVDSNWFRNMMMDYLRVIAEKGVMMEINTKAYGRRGMLFPDVRYFKELRELKIPLMVNSDAHEPEKINQGRAEVFGLLREAGIRSTVHLRKGFWEETEITV